MFKSDFDLLNETLEGILLRWRGQAYRIAAGILLVIATGFIILNGLLNTMIFFQWSFYAGTLLPLALVLSLIFFRRSNPRLKAYIFLLAIYIGALVDLLRFGMLGMGRVYMVVLPLLAVMLIDISAGFIITALDVLTLLLVGYLAHTSILNSLLQPEALFMPMDVWNQLTILSAVVMVSMLLIISVFTRFQTQTVKAEYSSATELKDTNQQLMLEIADRQAADLRAQFQVQRLKALREVDRAISANFDIKTVLLVVCQQIVLHLEADTVEISLINRRGELESNAFEGLPIRLPSRAIINENPRLVKLAMRKHKPVEMSDISQCTGVGDVYFENGQKIYSYFAIPLIIDRQSQGVLEVFHRFPVDSSQEWLDFLETLAGQTVIAVEHHLLLSSLERSNEELSQAYDSTLEGWAKALEMRDYETSGHSQRVTALTIALAQKVGVPAEMLPHIRRGALLHDIGKMAIPDSILLKPGKLSEEEWKIMKMHPIYAYDMLYPIDFLRPALTIPRYHHEKWDGTGYPDGLKGQDIPLEARIFAVADVWDALLGERPYKRPWGKNEALEYIRLQAGLHFDPDVVRAFEAIIQLEMSN
ncbi:MAG: HD domain-containing protein [Anaerolineae bacterium]|nr:HD domain-containing protein [Anaerolineae bacterium]